MMLKAIDTLGSVPFKVVASSGSWYIVRQHMLEVSPEAEIPEATSTPKVALSARISDEAYGLLRDFCTASCKGNFSLATEIAVLGFFKVKKVNKRKTCPPKPLSQLSP
jgi:hypothetical protein